MKEFAGYKWELRLPSNIDSEIDKGNEWEPVVSEWLRAQLKEGDIALDVGANIGWHTLLMSGCVEGKNGTVVAIEPEPSFRERLLGHLRINQIRNVMVFPWAMSDRSGVGWCVKNPGPYFSSAGMSDLPQPSAKEPVTQVQCVTIDEMWPYERLDVIKIDVDGWERRVLLGGEKTIQKFWPRITIEIGDTETAALLISWGYTLAWERGHRVMTIGEIGATITGHGTPTINMFAWHES